MKAGIPMPGPEGRFARIDGHRCLPASLAAPPTTKGETR